VKIQGKEFDYMEWVVIVCGDHHQEIHGDLGNKWNPKNKNKKHL